MALTCCLTSPKENRSALSLFFDSHKKQKVMFTEETTRLTKTWSTEVHLSFYQLVSGVFGAAETRLSPLVANRTRLPRLTAADSSRRIIKATLSFAFVGDFFDRYRTCHFVQCTACDGMASARSRPIDPGSSNWKQTKVLEPQLFHRALVDIGFSTRSVLNHVRVGLGIQGGTLATFVLNSDDYFSSSAQWQETEQTLQVVEEQLDKVFKVLTEWGLREKNRGPERPRWGRNDERDYRGVITKLESSISQSVRELAS